MADKTPRRIVGKIKRKRRPLGGGDPNGFLALCSGVIHVGANIGQERELYAGHGLKVVWIEPIPQIYDHLCRNIRAYPDQVAIRSLITDRDGETCTLHISSNYGASSSILDLHLHREIWPAVHYVNDIELISARLPSALRDSGIDTAAYDALAIDTQGSELLVLQGAEEILPRFKYIKAEAADFESYKSCPTVDEIRGYLGAQGFRLIRKDKFAERAAGGAYYELLFERVAPQ